MFLQSCSGNQAIPSENEVMQGSNNNYESWLSLDTLEGIATGMLTYKLKEADAELSKVIIYKEKGVLVYLFKNSPWQIQLDAASGRVLKIEEHK